MNWIETKIYTTTEGTEIITGILIQLGITGFIIEDAKDLDDFLNDRTVIWDYIDESVMKLKDSETNITVYLADNMQGREIFITVKDELAKLKDIDKNGTLGRLEIETQNVNEDDWANNWKQYFKPFEVGEKFVIKPSWEAYSENTDRFILEIDPNSSFGTGQHETTQLCIEQLEKTVNCNDRVLDVGCGSGILSIASILLGAQYVTAVDIDENSVNITLDNFNKNHMTKDKFQTYCGNIIENELLQEVIGFRLYDVITANIVADVIIAMKDILGKFLKTGGLLIASGIIGERSDEVIQALTEGGFLVKEVNEKNDWIVISAQLK